MTKINLHKKDQTYSVNFDTKSSTYQNLNKLYKIAAQVKKGKTWHQANQNPATQEEQLQAILEIVIQIKNAYDAKPHKTNLLRKLTTPLRWFISIPSKDEKIQKIYANIAALVEKKDIPATAQKGITTSPQDEFQHIDDEMASYLLKDFSENEELNQKLILALSNDVINIKSVAKLCKDGADLNTTNEQGQSALELILLSDQLLLVETVFKAHRDAIQQPIMCSDGIARTPLLFAIYEDLSTAFQAILKFDDPNRSEHDIPIPLHALMHVSKNPLLGSVTFLVLLRDRKTDVNILDAEGKSLLWWAIDQAQDLSQDRIETIGLLLDKGATVTSEDLEFAEQKAKNQGRSLSPLLHKRLNAKILT